MLSEIMITGLENISSTKDIINVVEKSSRVSPGAPIRNSVDAKLCFVVTRNCIEVRLLNGVAISALRIEITFNEKFKYNAPELCERIQSLNSYINFQENVLTLVLLDIDGKGIPAGEGKILMIPYDHEQEFHVTAAYGSTHTSSVSELEFAVTEPATSDEAVVLEQNDPNPFYNVTKIEFEIPETSNLKMVIYDVCGGLVRTIMDSPLPAGTHSIEWDGNDDNGKTVDAGVYLYKLYAGVYSVTRKMVLLR